MKNRRYPLVWAGLILWGGALMVFQTISADVAPKKQVLLTLRGEAVKANYADDRLFDLPLLEKEGLKADASARLDLLSLLNKYHQGSWKKAKLYMVFPDDQKENLFKVGDGMILKEEFSENFYEVTPEIMKSLKLKIGFDAEKRFLFLEKGGAKGTPSFIGQLYRIEFFNDVT